MGLADAAFFSTAQWFGIYVKGPLVPYMVVWMVWAHILLSV